MNAQPGTSFERWATAHAVRLNTVEVSSDVADLREVSRLIGSARVVALGELGHGAHEPLALRNRLFEYLVEHEGFTAIAIESALPDSRQVEEFVNGGPGEAPQIIYDNLSWGFGALQENVELVQWMRTYNSNPAHHPVRFYGIDLNLGGPRLSTPTRTALDAALAYLARVSPREAKESETDLQPFLDRLPNIASLSAPEHQRFATAISHLIALLQLHRPPAAAPTLTDYEWAERDAFVARDAARMFAAAPATASTQILPSDGDAAQRRDHAMADNVRWVVRQEGPTGRVLVFAHNAHVKNAPTEGGIWAVLPRPLGVMGMYLRQAFGKDMVIIGTSSMANPSEPSKRTPDSKSVDDALARVGVPLFMLDLRAARADRAANEWLSERHTLRANFSTSLTLSPSKAFDALVFIDALTKAHLNQQVR
jgi:erythromycin esterase